MARTLEQQGGSKVRHCVYTLVSYAVKSTDHARMASRHIGNIISGLNTHGSTGDDTHNRLNLFSYYYH